MSPGGEINTARSLLLTERVNLFEFRLHLVCNGLAGGLWLCGCVWGTATETVHKQKKGWPHTQTGRQAPIRGPNKAKGGKTVRAVSFCFLADGSSC